MKKLNLAKVRPLIQMAIEEDLGRGDVTRKAMTKDSIWMYASATACRPTSEASSVQSKGLYALCSVPNGLC